jgi:hypothetical protein
MQITRKEAEEKIAQLEGMFICHTWKGYGTAVFLELVKSLKDSEISIPKEASKTNLVGKADIFMWYWRVEQDMKIICGSSDSMPEIEEGICCLNGLKIESIKVIGIIPELVIILENGFRVLSFNSASSSDFNWHLKQIDEKYICYEETQFYETVAGEKDDGKESHLKNELSKQAELTAKRWGIPKEEPVAGLCRNCVYEVRLNGHYDLLSYSVCVNGNSIFDGKVIGSNSGCTKFLLDDKG